MLGYKGSFAYKMQAGMGDTICTPLFAVLHARGVRFEFFHRVDRLALDPADGRLVGAIHLTRQAELRPEVRAEGYWPVVRAGELHCWPDRPDVGQLADGARIEGDPAYPYQLESNRAPLPGAPQVVLRRGVDFDEVVLAIPVAALDRICGDLIARDASWQRMVRGDGDRLPVGTVRTQAFQLWLRRLSPAAEAERAALQRRQGRDPQRHRALLGGYAEPFDTWCDMSHLLPRESWPARAEAGSIAYVCGPMADAVGAEPSDPRYLAAESARVREHARRWLAQHWAALWPEFLTVRTPPRDWARVLVDPGAGPGDAFDRQFFRANVDPSDRYVAIFAGTTGARLAPDRSGFRNLVLAGDWVLNPVLSAGAAEPTIASGMAAARALSGYPLTIYGESPRAERAARREGAEG
jgi:uncharacterized protein with NAD-binding domain and iron-sulfur cluster